MLRIGLGCALLSAVGLVELGTTSGADSSFVVGNAQAQSQAISLAPTTGGLSYAITLATSIADYQGSVIAEGTPAEVLEHPAVIESYLGTDEATINRSGVKV